MILGLTEGRLEQESTLSAFILPGELPGADAHLTGAVRTRIPPTPHPSPRGCTGGDLFALVLIRNECIPIHGEQRIAHYALTSGGIWRTEVEEEAFRCVTEQLRFLPVLVLIFKYHLSITPFHFVSRLLQFWLLSSPPPLPLSFGFSSQTAQRHPERSPPPPPPPLQTRTINGCDRSLRQTGKEITRLRSQAAHLLFPKACCSRPPPDSL